MVLVTFFPKDTETKSPDNTVSMYLVTFLPVYSPRKLYQARAITCYL